MEKWTKGRASICIDRTMEPQGIQYPVGGSLYWNVAEVQELLDLWDSHLQLPEQYTLAGCFFDAVKAQWVLVVESEDIPLPKRDEEIPRLYPLYEYDTEARKARIVIPCDVKPRPEGV